MHAKLLLAQLLLAGTALATSLPLRIVTWNIRYAATSLEDNEKSWWTVICYFWHDQCRMYDLRDFLTATAANATDGTTTIFGLQEVLHSQLEDIMDAFGSDWGYIGTGRDDGVESGEYNPILFRPDLLKLLYSEQKWLSETPDVVSYGWDAGSRRVVVIGVFEDIATGKRFIHANTHLDNVGSEARIEGIKAVVERIQAVQDLYGPIGVTLTGDFNSDPNGDAYPTLENMDYLTEMWNSGAERLGTNQLTYTGFSDTGVSRIDFIWFGPNGDDFYAANQWEILGDKSDDGVYMSDHREVFADLTLL